MGSPLSTTLLLLFQQRRNFSLKERSSRRIRIHTKKTLKPYKISVGPKPRKWAELFDFILPQSLDKVSKCFNKYSFYHFLESATCNVFSCLGAFAMFFGLGLEDFGTVASLTAIVWAMKDAVGEIVKLIFTKYASPYFDTEPKAMKILGEAFFLIGTIALVNIAAVQSLGLYLVLAIFGTSVIGMSWVIDEASTSFFLRNLTTSPDSVLSDLFMRSEIQSVLGEVIGLLISLCILYPFTYPSVAAVCSPLTAMLIAMALALPFHLFAVVMELVWLHVPTLPQRRFLEFLGQYISLDNLKNDPTKAEQRDGKEKEKELETVDEYYQKGLLREFQDISLTFQWNRGFRLGSGVRGLPSLVFGGSVSAISPTFPLERLMEFHKKDRYMAYYNFEDPQLYLFLHKNVTRPQFWQGICHLVKLHALLRESGCTADDINKFFEMSEKSRIWSQEHTNVFIDELEELGWDSDTIIFSEHGFRYLSAAEVETVG